MKKLFLWTGALIMSIYTADKEFIREILYKDVNYLQDRLSVFQYATNKEHIWDWTWKKLPITKPCKILEVGAGFGTYWHHNVKKLPTGCELTLTDISESMLDSCKTLINTLPLEVTYQIADVENLPFNDNSFDIIVAHFLLYYTDSPQRALRELKRVVKKNGIVSIFILHSDSNKRLFEMAHEVDTRFPQRDETLKKFCEINAEEMLNTFFSSYEKHIYATDIVVPSGESMIKSLKSMAIASQISITPEIAEAYKNKIDEYRDRNGEFRSYSKSILFNCKS